MTTLAELRLATTELSNEALHILIQRTISDLRDLQDRLDVLTSEKYARDMAFYSNEDRRKPDGTT